MGWLLRTVGLLSDRRERSSTGLASGSTWQRNSERVSDRAAQAHRHTHSAHTRRTPRTLAPHTAAAQTDEDDRKNGFDWRLNSPSQFRY